MSPVVFCPGFNGSGVRHLPLLFRALLAICLSTAVLKLDHPFGSSLFRVIAALHKVFSVIPSPFTVFELVRLTHSCARNADLTSSGHAVWPSLLHKPLIRSMTTSLILLQTSLIISSWWEFMLIFRLWWTTFYGGFRPNSIIKSTCTLVVPAWIEQATRGFSVPCSNRLSYRTTKRS